MYKKSLISRLVFPIALALFAGASISYLMVMPGKSFAGPVPAADAGIAARLRAHVEAIARTEHNTANAGRLEQAAVYIESTLAAQGYTSVAQPFEAGGQTVRNIEVSLANLAPGEQPQRVLVVGAHYDSARGAPGANDNGSGTAGLLELARELKGLVPARGTELKLVFYTNEEPPYFQRDGMGSRVHAQDLKKRGVKVEAALILETIGYYSNEPGSQHYPVSALKMLYPSAGNFVAVVGTLDAAGLVRQTAGALRQHASVPVEGLAAPAFVQGVDWSDHSSYAKQGYPAVMITDTAVMRYPHYHKGADTPDKLDYGKMALLTSALVPVIRTMAGNQSAR